MSCKCGSPDSRILTLSGKTADSCYGNFDGAPYKGYVPRIAGIGGGDYISIRVCMDCGTLQGFKPVSDEDVNEALGREPPEDLED